MLQCNWNHITTTFKIRLIKFNVLTVSTNYKHVLLFDCCCCRRCHRRCRRRRHTVYCTHLVRQKLLSSQKTNSKYVFVFAFVYMCVENFAGMLSTFKRYIAKMYFHFTG